jgi:hypothetical protein
MYLSIYFEKRYSLPRFFLFNFFSRFFLDPPEIEIEQNWFQPSGEKTVEVELMCTVHSNPDAEVFFIAANLHSGFQY